MTVLSPGLLGGNQDQAHQMNALFPLVLLDKSLNDKMQNGFERNVTTFYDGF